MSSENHPEYTQLICALEDAEQLIARLNYAFYVEGTTKAMKPIMAETKPMLAAIRQLVAEAKA